jgi:hypothetical protein
MFSTLYHEILGQTGGKHKRTRILKSQLGDQLDEIAVFALVAVAVLYIAAASCWFVL